MSEHNRNGKTFAQDALGFLFCLVGGFFAVSIVLALRGQEPKPGLISALAWPVVELVVLLGSAAALLFSVGLAALGTMLFLRPTPLNALRPLLALVFGSLGVALIFGAFGSQSVLGAWLPGLVPGFVGSVLAFVLGTALAWLGWTILATERVQQRATSSADVVQRIGLAARHDAAAGVSPAEAALLVAEPRAPAARPAPQREATTRVVPQRDAAVRAIPVRDETIRPFTPQREVPARDSGAKRAEVPVAAARSTPGVAPLAASATVAEEAPISVLTPPPPSWETADEDEEEGVEEPLAAAPAASVLEQDVLEEEQELEEEEEIDEDGADEDEEPLEALAAEFETEEEEEVEAEVETGMDIAAEAPPVPRASWEQSGLFDEEEEVLEEAPPAKPAKVELTSTFDFEPAESTTPNHEPEPSEEDPFAIETAPAAAKLPEFLLEPAPAPKVAPKAAPKTEPRPEPKAAPKPEPKAEPKAEPKSKPEPTIAGDEGERWNKLVFEAGCAILEQQRVAVSMLERRFAIDFDQACAVLDALQQAGLIGPYMGGRTRDILLTREQWQPHAPHAS